MGNGSGGIFWGIDDKGVLNHSGSDLGVLSIAVTDPNWNIAAFIMTNISADEDPKLMSAAKKIRDTLNTITNMGP